MGIAGGWERGEGRGWGGTGQACLAWLKQADTLQAGGGQGGGLKRELRCTVAGGWVGGAGKRGSDSESTQRDEGVREEGGRGGADGRAGE